ncbi:MAG: hypothetical protein JWO47_915 [Candidatus Saccharibacteria bacterium]|nr:hypothetical protein [Candidatus Saccharibacteria bacterium]
MVLVVVLIMGIILLPAKKSSADPAPCTLDSTPQLAASQDQINFQFNLTNGTGNDPIKRILISAPSSDFVFLSINAPGWDSAVTGSGAEFYNNNLDPDSTVELTVTVQTGAYIAGEIDWGVYAFDGNDSSGYGNIICQNNSPLNMIDNVAHISSAAVSDVTSSSVKISWITSLPADSVVNYGADSSYGSTNTTAPDPVTQHAVVLKGLQSNTAYHYQIVSTTQNSTSDTSADATFLTALEQAPLVKTINIPGLSISISDPSDKTPPSIKLDPIAIQKVYKTAPTIKGSADDNSAIVRVEYSTDNGKNWLPVDTSTGLGTKNAGFSFTPLSLDDGSYTMLARAIDGGGNISTTPSILIVIDRLPPLVGGLMLSIGPQILGSNQNGETTIIAGLDEKITLSAVGGASGISLHTVSTNTKEAGKSFALTQSSDTGLWSGIISFTKAGTYSLIANAVDGAGNKTTKNLGTILAKEPAKILKADGKPASATVTVYFLDSETGNWVIWDGSSYSQDNPQKTVNDGSFKLFLPAGSYYLKASGNGFAAITTQTFKLTQPTPILPTLKAGSGGDLLHSFLSKFSTQTVDFSPAQTKKPTAATMQSLVGDQLPDFALNSTSGKLVHAVDLLARPTVISFMSTWAPTTSEQLPALDELSANKDINIEPIALQQDVSKMQAYQAISGHKLTWLADPDSTTSRDFNITNLPTHYFVNREGVIKKIVNGVLSKSELLNIVSGL